MTVPTPGESERALGSLHREADRQHGSAWRFAWQSLTRADPRAGFTLLEVTLTLTIVGLIATLALPRALPDATSTALRIKAFEVAALLRADRNAALRSGRTVATDVDLVARRVRSSLTGRWITLPNVFTIRLTTGAPRGFQFFPDGTSSGGELILARPGSEIALRVNERTAAVSIRRGAAGNGG